MVVGLWWWWWRGRGGEGEGGGGGGECDDGGKYNGKGDDNEDISIASNHKLDPITGSI